MKRVVLCGTGIESISHLTRQSISAISQADVVLYIVNEPIIEEWIQKNSKKCESLDTIYFSKSNRAESYSDITDYIISTSKNVDFLCVVYYGHPCFYAESGIKAIKKIRENDKEVSAYILPAISSISCLFSDLLIDPGDGGFACYDSTEFLLEKKKFDSSSHLILFQIGLLGTYTHSTKKSPERDKMYQLLSSRLSTEYEEEHEAILYTASQYPTVSHESKSILLKDLSYNYEKLSKICTLYIPPKHYLS